MFSKNSWRRQLDAFGQRERIFCFSSGSITPYLTLTSMGMMDVRDLLLASRLDSSHVAALLTPFGLTDFEKADANLQTAAGEPSERLLLAEILADLLESVSGSANPDQALTYFERFAAAASSRAYLF